VYKLVSKQYINTIVHGATIKIKKESESSICSTCSKDPETATYWGVQEHCCRISHQVSRKYEKITGAENRNIYEIKYKNYLKRIVKKPKGKAKIMWINA